MLLESLNRDFSAYDILEDYGRIDTVISDFIYEREDAPTDYFLELVVDIEEWRDRQWRDLEALASKYWMLPNHPPQGDYSLQYSWVNAALTLFQAPSLGARCDDIDIGADPTELFLSEKDKELHRHMQAFYNLTKKEMIEFVTDTSDFMTDFFSLRCTFEIIDHAMQVIDEHNKRYQKLITIIDKDES